LLVAGLRLRDAAGFGGAGFDEREATKSSQACRVTLHTGREAVLVAMFIATSSPVLIKVRIFCPATLSSRRSWSMEADCHPG
jgi:hypothetical protein